jgi:hypothetical protein
VDAHHPIVQVDVKSKTPCTSEVIVEVWRTEKRKLNRVSGRLKESHSAAYNNPKKLLVNPDTILPHGPAQLAWCHRNIDSQWQANLKLTALGEQIGKGKDPILHRTFGAVVRAAGFTATSDTVLKTKNAVQSFSVRIFIETHFADSAQAWLTTAKKQADTITASTDDRFAAHRTWWRNYWNRSWIFVSANKPAKNAAEQAAAKSVTQAYILQRFLNACAGRGAFPIKFNGSLFTVDQVFDPDYRQWGGAYWWQNTRLPYWGMLYSGDYDMMLPLFKMYRDALPLRQAATKKYYGHDGAFYPETMYFWGNFTDENYGLNRKGKPDGLTANTYIRRYWQGGLELVGMMLDYYDATRDAAFRDDTLLPVAKAVTTFFDQHWKRGDDGKVLYSPAQSLETWHVATDPIPEIVALRYLLPRLLELPADKATRAMWKKLLADQPDVPSVTKDGKTRLLPARKYSKRKNIENPELYAVFPYRMYTVSQGGEALKTGINTWKVRKNRANIGWQQQPIQAALLGLTNEAKNLVTQRVKAKARGYRFPGFYGPNYDWTPDQDHLSVFMIGIQRMLMQCEGDRILILPAWPKEWDVSFKLHAPKNTTVEAVVKNGKVKMLTVTPESRRKDIELQNPGGAEIQSGK